MNSKFPAWIEELSEDDLELMKQFVLQSGSLKSLAEKYEVSYPTIRVRVDKLIALIQNLSLPGIEESPLKRTIQTMVARGELHQNSARKILESHQETIKEYGTLA